MSSHRPSYSSILLLVGAVLIGALVWMRCSDRAAVERSLDRLVFYRYEPAPGGVRTVYSGTETTNTESYQTILCLGKKAAPTLQQTLSEPAQWRSSRERWAAWWAGVNQKIRGKGGAPVSPPTYPETQRKRKFAAGVMLLAIAEANGGGFAPLMESCGRIVAADRRNPKTGPQGGIIPSEMIRQALQLCPERRQEIASAVVAGMWHPDPFCRFIAANASRAMPELAQGIAPVLIERLGDTNEFVQLESLFALMPARWPVTNPPPAVQPMEAMKAIERMMTNSANSARVRQTAGTVIGK